MQRSTVGAVSFSTTFVFVLFLPLAVAGADLTVSGTWQTADAALTGTWSAELTVSGADVNGSIALEDFPNAGTHQELSGTLVDGQLHFGVLRTERLEGHDPTLVTFDGSVAGQVVSGQFSTPQGLSGTWEGNVGSGE